MVSSTCSWPDAARTPPFLYTPPGKWCGAPDLIHVVSDDPVPGNHGQVLPELLTNLPLSIVIPTYRRETVLLRSIQQLLELRTQPDEILVVDQTVDHLPETARQLDQWHAAGLVRWMRREEPSITMAMNHGLDQADSELVLFLDDDIEPVSDLVAEHSSAHDLHPELWATVGQVVQPWQQPEAVQPPRRQTGLGTDRDFPFHSTLDHDVQNVMAGNLCVNREKALSIGGFDENFIGSAYRFETEFARRISNAGGRIRFLGAAGIKHLRVNEGGTRSKGSHLKSASPRHGIGDHYYAFLHGSSLEAWCYCIRRVVREVSTKFHATHPWWIPVKVIGELRALRGGWKLARTRRSDSIPHNEA